MKKFITLFATVALLLVSHICQGQIHFSKTANVYDDSNNAKVGQQYIAANTKRDNYYLMTAYSVELVTPDKKYLDVVITKRDKGTYSVLVYFADGKLRYDFSTSN